MIKKIQYGIDKSREQVIAENDELILIEEQNIFTGNFLIFSDIKPLEENIKDIKNNTDIIILKQEGII